MASIIHTYFLVNVSNSLTYILRFLEIEALAGLLRVAPASMAASMGSMSELFPFSLSEISSGCVAMIMALSKYQDARRQAYVAGNLSWI